MRRQPGGSLNCAQDTLVQDSTGVVIVAVHATARNVPVDESEVYLVRLL